MGCDKYFMFVGLRTCEYPNICRICYICLPQVPERLAFRACVGKSGVTSTYVCATLQKKSGNDWIDVESNLFCF